MLLVSRCVIKPWPSHIPATFLMLSRPQTGKATLKGDEACLSRRPGLLVLAVCLGEGEVV